MKSFPAVRKHIRAVEGPIAIGRSCTLCRWHVTAPKMDRPGRGWGFVAGNKLNGLASQHLKSAHPDAVIEAHEEWLASQRAYEDWKIRTGRRTK